MVFFEHDAVVDLVGDQPQVVLLGEREELVALLRR